jgi:hypothetical protein
MRWAQITVKANPVGNTLDESARTAPARIPLVTVHQLVGHDARDFSGQSRWRVDPVDVGEREVDLLMIGIKLGLGPLVRFGWE